MGPVIAREEAVVRVSRAMPGFLVSLATAVVAFVPVMVFTFLGLNSGYRIQETNPLFAGYFAADGLVPGLFLALLTNSLIAVVILGLLHLVYYRPLMFYDPDHLAFARKLIVAGIGLFLLTWGEKFFADSSHDMTVLNENSIGPGWFLSTIFISCLLAFLVGMLYWAWLVWPVARPRPRPPPDEVVLSTSPRVNAPG